MKSYKDLQIYTVSYDLGLKVHHLTLKLPQYELFEEGSQARRSSKGICSCIVEGYGRKRYKADWIKFLVYAHASCDETILHLNFIKDSHPENAEACKELIDFYEKLGSKINRFIQFVEKDWKGPR